MLKTLDLYEKELSDVVGLYKEITETLDEHDNFLDLDNTQLQKLLIRTVKMIKEMNEADDGDLQHCIEMIPKMRDFLTNSKIEKYNRWLGFIQGVLWSKNLYTLDELKKHNKL